MVLDDGYVGAALGTVVSETRAAPRHGPHTGSFRPLCKRHREQTRSIVLFCRKDASAPGTTSFAVNNNNR